MNLPEPNFIERNPVEITKELINIYEAKTGKTLQPAQQERIMIDVIAYYANLNRIAVQEAAKQNLVNFASFPMLDYLGEFVGVSRLEAASARTTLRFTIQAQTFDVTYPAGIETESKDNNVVFRTLSNLKITAGNTIGEIEAEAEQTGVIGNGYIAGDIKYPLSALPYLIDVVNTTTSSGGADEESDDSYRERIKLAPESFSNAGSKQAYIFHAKSAHQDIIDVEVNSPSAGVVNVYPLTKTGTPSAEMLNIVINTLTDEKIRPLTDNVNVIAPIIKNFSISVNAILYPSPDAELVRLQIIENIQDYILELQSKLGESVIPSKIIEKAQVVTGVSEINYINPSAKITVNSNEWANCTAATITVGY